MKKIIGLLILTLLLASCSIEQGLKDDEIDTHGLSSEGKSAIIEKKTGNTIITTSQFNEVCGYYSKGYCSVRKGELSGFIDTHGKLVIPYQFNGSIGNFHDGLVRFQKSDSNGKYINGFADTDGDVAFTYEEKEYSPYQDFSDGFAGGMLIITKKYGDSIFGAVNKKGKIVIPIAYNKLGEKKWNSSYDTDNFSDGEVNIWTGSNSNHTYQTGSLYSDGTIKWNEKQK